MKTFLQVVEPLLPASQLKRISAIVAHKQQVQDIISPEEAQLEIQRLLQTIDGTKGFVPSFKARLPRFSDDVISSEEINAMMEELDIDLGTLFDMANKLSGASKGQQKILRSNFENIRAKIAKLYDDVFSYRKLKNSTSYARVITQGFASGENNSPAGIRAVIDPQTRGLKLPATIQRRHHQERGINPASVEVINLSSAITGISSRTFSPENAIDPDEESFWTDVVVSEAPIRTDYTNLNGLKTTYDGALVEIRLKLGVAEAITDVKVLPFGEYPIDVIDIKYRQESNWYQYAGFVDKDPSLNWLEWTGPRVVADEVAFVLQQATYNRRVYHIPKSLLEISTFWEQLLDEQSQLTLSDESLSELQQARAVADSHTSSLIEASRRYQIELQRLDVPSKDPDSRTVSETDVLADEVEALANSMYADKTVGLRLRPHSKQDEPGDELIVIERIEYVVGAREIQVNTTEYLPEAWYSSPKYRPDSTILNIQIDPIEESPSFSDINGSYKLTSFEYDIEIAPGRRVPLLPKGLTTVADELLVLDRTTRSDTTRFTSTTLSNITIRKDGAFLSSANYTTELLSTNYIRVTINPSAFSRNSRYSISYVAATGSDAFDIETLYDSVRIDRPEIFDKTDDGGSIELQFYPFVDYSIVNDEDNFSKEGTRSSRWIWVGTKQQVVRDGVMYGDINTTIEDSISAVSTSIELASAVTAQSADLPAKMKIGSEIIQYTGISTNTLTGVTRGVDGTVAQSHAAGTRIAGIKVYDPITVNVGGIKAHNITDYLSGKHPAFLSLQEENQRFEYLHIGNRLYFNRPILGKPISVQYNWMAQYIQLHTLLRSHSVGRVSYTPTLRRFHLEVESTVL